MKTCPTRIQLEAAVMGEVPEGRLSDCETHAEHCARCRHELNWLRSEQAMFGQRAAREEVSRLWEGAPRRKEARAEGFVTRALLAVGATVLFAVTIGGHVTSRGSAWAHVSGDDALQMSLETMSIEHQQMASAELASLPCYTPGFGPACE